MFMCESIIKMELLHLCNEKNFLQVTEGSYRNPRDRQINNVQNALMSLSFFFYALMSRGCRV